jgi:hypothetical protein
MWCGYVYIIILPWAFFVSVVYAQTQLYLGIWKQSLSQTTDTLVPGFGICPVLLDNIYSCRNNNLMTYIMLQWNSDQHHICNTLDASCYFSRSPRLHHSNFG